MARTFANGRPSFRFTYVLIHQLSPRPIAHARLAEGDRLHGDVGRVAGLARDARLGGDVAQDARNVRGQATTGLFQRLREVEREVDGVELG